MSSDVLVVIGVGGMGLSIARRLGPGRSVLLADYAEPPLQDTAKALRADGYDVHTLAVDVASPQSVASVVEAARSLGPVRHVAHTAGLSPSQATAERILAVNLLGAALVIDGFADVIADNGAGVVIASMAGHLSPPPSQEQSVALATAAPEDLLALPFVESVDDPLHAYGLSKQANRLRVQAASLRWGARNARLNSISPGVISTPMGRDEQASASGEVMRALVAGSPAKRVGTPQDITAAAVFLLGPDSSFITGTDLLVDGGAVAATRFGNSGARHRR